MIGKPTSTIRGGLGFLGRVLLITQILPLSHGKLKRGGLLQGNQIRYSTCHLHEYFGFTRVASAQIVTVHNRKKGKKPRVAGEQLKVTVTEVGEGRVGGVWRRKEILKTWDACV